MLTPPHSILRFRPSLPFTALCVLLLALWIAGGASRADAAGQAIVRGVAAFLLAVMFLFGDRPGFGGVRAIWLLLTAAIALPLIQLIPLPPDWWGGLPGRGVILEAAAASGQPQPWRPWSLSPGSTTNAAASLIVPLATLIFAAGVRPTERPRTVAVLLVLILATTLIGLLQFSGSGLNNPFINETVGQVSGNFANRNHFALLLAIGCAMAPAWAFLDGHKPRWRGPAAFGLVLLFMLTILASGSRAGILLGMIGLTIGLVLAWRGIRKELSRFPRWAFPVLIAGIIATVALFVLISIAAGRAESISRVIAIDPGQDMRGRGLPVVLEMIRTYFPAGTGLGSFDALFRMHEPFGLLKLTYFNHAHNDLLEVVLDAGLPGLLLLLAALLWWAAASFRAWRVEPAAQHMLPRLGSVVLLLIIIASIFDYPARTPMMMAMIVLASGWLSGIGERSRSALR